MSRSAKTLTLPSGTTVRCAAQKRYALVTEYDGKATTLFRTNDAKTLDTRGRREAKRLGRDVHVFRLTDATYLGGYRA